MTTETPPEYLERDPRIPDEIPRTRSSRRRLALRVMLVIEAAIAVAAITYGISKVVQPTYQSSTQVRIVVNGASGLGQDAVLASNDLTAQLVQLVPTNAVLTAPAIQLGMSTDALRSSISVGSVSQENLMQITADGPNPVAAQRRAQTVTKDFLSFMAKDSQRQLQNYATNLANGAKSLNGPLAQIAAGLQSATGGRAAALETELGSISSQQQSLRNDLAQRQASSVPVVQQVQSAGRGTQIAPKPTLYALVAFIVAGLIAAEILVFSERRRRAKL